MLTVQVVRSADAWDDLRDAWDALHAATGESSLFLTFEWQRTWWRHFGAGRELLILVLRDGERISGIVPWCIRPVSQGRTPFRKIEFIGAGLSDRLDFLLPENPREHLERVHDCLAGREVRWDLIDLADVPESSLGLLAWQSIASEHGLPHRLEAGSVCPYLVIEGDWEAFFTRRFDGKDRRRLRNLEKNLARYGAPVMRVITDIATEPGVIDRLAGLAQGSNYRGRKRHGMFADPVKRRFYEEISRVFSERGWLCVAVLEAGERLVAYRYGFQYEGRHHDYFPGYDEALTACAPGRILLTRLMEDCFRRGLREYDFLRGTEPYKYEWTDAERRNLRFTVFRPSLYAPILQLAYRARSRRRTAAAVPVRSGGRRATAHTAHARDGS